MQILCVKTGKGRKHDFRMFKESKTHIHPSVHVQVDTGYQALKIIIPTLEYLTNAVRKNHLQKSNYNNHTICSSRMTVEHVIRELKVFRILSERYRN